MMRRYNNEKIETVEKYINRLIENTDDIINNYLKLYSNDELTVLLNAKLLFERTADELLNLDDIKNHVDLINNVFETEESIKSLTFRTWEYENKNGKSFISWLKDDKYQDGKKLVFSTFNEEGKDVFCDSSVGIKYDVDINGFIGATEIDGATIMLDSNESCLYTIANINDKSINSYNMATMIASPNIVINNLNNKYQSKHNEIILDNRYIKPIEIVYNNELSKQIAEDLSIKLNVPLKYIGKTNAM